MFQLIIFNHQQNVNEAAVYQMHLLTATPSTLGETEPMKSIIFFLYIIIFVTDCNSEQKTGKETISSPNPQAPELFSDTSSYPRIYEYNNGGIELNGASADIQSIERKLQEVSKKGTIVFYSSESPTEDPPSSGRVSDLFKKHSVNIQTYTDKTFTKSYY